MRLAENTISELGVENVRVIIKELIKNKQRIKGLEDELTAKITQYKDHLSNLLELQVTNTVWTEKTEEPSEYYLQL